MTNKYKDLIKMATLLIVTIVTLLPTAASAQANAQTFTESRDFPLDNSPLYVPCTGETIYLSGNIHDLFHETQLFDNSFSHEIKTQENPMGVIGLSTTGETFRGTGVTEQSLEYESGLFTITYLNNFRIIGQGSVSNYLVHENLHVTILPDGTITTSHDNFAIDCR